MVYSFTDIVLQDKIRRNLNVMSKSIHIVMRMTIYSSYLGSGPNYKGIREVVRPSAKIQKVSTLPNEKKECYGMVFIKVMNTLTIQCEDNF